MDSVLSEIKPESPEKHLISKTQIVVLAFVLVLAGGFFINRQFGWLDRFFYERISIPSGAPYAEARVVGAYEGMVLAERAAAKDAQGNALQKKLEILTDGKTVFARITSSGPVKISRTELSEGDVIWIYKRVRSLQETIAEPADPKLAIPLAEMLKNPRERIRAEYIVVASTKK